MNKALLFVLLFSATVFGQCLTDSDTGHPSSDYNTRLFSYSPRSATQASTSSSLTFMSFNLQSGFSLYCVNNPTLQAQQMTTADYVGTQETVQNVDTRCNRCNIPQIIADTTGMQSRFMMTLPWRTGQFGINAATSQTILETKTQLLSYSGVEQRAVVAVRTQPAALGGRNLWFINTHVEFYVYNARISQVTQIVQFAQSLASADPNAVIALTGDFNGGADDGAYPILSAFFQNSWAVYNGNANNGYTHPSDYPSTRFDHVWFRVPSGVTAHVTSFTVVDVLLSDHRPVRTTIQFSVAGSSPSTPAPSTPAPAKPATAAPTNAPPKGATSAPAPSTPAPSSGGSCSASISSNSASTVVIKNTGSKPITNIVISFSPSIPSNNWNFVSAGNNHYTIPSWAFQSLATNGATYSSSGYYTTGTAPTATVVSVTC